MLGGALVYGRYMWVESLEEDYQTNDELLVSFGRAKAMVTGADQGVSQKVQLRQHPEINKVRLKAPPEKKVKTRIKEPVVHDFKGFKRVEINKPREIVYEVKSGDRLDLISYRFYKTHHKYYKILAANPNVSPETLRPGMKLVIPDVKKPKAHLAFKVANRVNKQPYVIKKNEVLSTIAEKQLGSIKFISVILDFNPGLNPNKIREGQTIYLPVKKKRNTTKFN